jgi:hypothetical protein
VTAAASAASSGVAVAGCGYWGKTGTDFDSQGFAPCPATGEKYQMTDRGVVRLGVSREV